MLNIALVLLLTSLILLVVGIYYYNFKSKPKDLKVLFKDIQIPPTIKSTEYNHLTYSKIPKKE